MFKPDIIFTYEVPRRPENVTIQFRFPSDAQIIERAKKRKRLVTNLGRQGLEERDDITFSDADLLRELQGENAVELTDSEATRIINAILNIEVTLCERQGKGYHVEFTTAVGSMQVDLLTPTADELESFIRTLAVSRVLDSRRQSTWSNLQAANDLWAAIGADTQPLPVYWRTQILLELHGVVQELATRRQNPT